MHRQPQAALLAIVRKFSAEEWEMVWAMDACEVRALGSAFASTWRGGTTSLLKRKEHVQGTPWALRAVSASTWYLNVRGSELR